MSIKNALKSSVKIIDPIAYYGDPQIAPKRTANERLFWDQLVKSGSARLKKLAAKVSTFNLWGVKYFREYFAESDIVAIIMLFDLDESKEQINSVEIVGPMVDLTKPAQNDGGLKGILTYNGRYSTIADRKSVSRQPLFFLERSLVRVNQMILGSIRDNRPKNDLEKKVMDIILSSPTQEECEPGWLLKKINN
jgi:hypothetical protein